MHKYCEEMANLLNEHGIAVSVVYTNIEANHTKETVKELWRAFARAKYGKKSTTEYTSQDIDAIYDEVNRHISRFGISLPFPSQENTAGYLSSLEAMA